MRNKSKRLTALLMTLVMCFATLAPAMVVFATEETSSTTPQYIAQETFDGDTLNTSADDAAIKSAGGFWFKMDSGSTYTLENGTLKYLDRAPGDFTGIRLFLDESQKSQLQDDFILSFRIKALAPSISTGELYWKSSSEGNGSHPYISPVADSL